MNDSNDDNDSSSSSPVFGVDAAAVAADADHHQHPPPQNNNNNERSLLRRIPPVPQQQAEKYKQDNYNNSNSINIDSSDDSDVSSHCSDESSSTDNDNDSSFVSLPLHYQAAASSSFLEQQSNIHNDSFGAVNVSGCSTSSSLATFLRASALAMEVEITFSTAATEDTTGTSSPSSKSSSSDDGERSNSNTNGSSGSSSSDNRSTNDSTVAADATTATATQNQATKQAPKRAKIQLATPPSSKEQQQRDQNKQKRKRKSKIKQKRKEARRIRCKRLAGFLAFIFVAVVIIVAVPLAIVSSRKKRLNTAASASNSSGTSTEEPPLRIAPSISMGPSPEPSPAPLATPSRLPSAIPSGTPSLGPSVTPSAQPSSGPSLRPTTSQPTLPLIQTAAFFAIGDAPYTDIQAQELDQQMRKLATMDDRTGHVFDFVIHVGDIRSATDNPPCRLQEYKQTAEILRKSPIPVFVTLGDNEWNDCPNRNTGWNHWINTFQGFESRYWNHTFQIERMPNRPETFSFVHKGTLFIGLNLVGGTAFNTTEWSERLSSQATWTMTLIRQHVFTTTVNNLFAGTIVPSMPIVIFGHANPIDDHDDFFIPMQAFIRDELNDDIPVLYLNGDKHEWGHDVTFYEQPNWSRIMLTGGTSEPPLRVFVQSHREGITSTLATDAFAYDRQL